MLYNAPLQLRKEWVKHDMYTPADWLHFCQTNLWPPKDKKRVLGIRERPYEVRQLIGISMWSGTGDKEDLFSVIFCLTDEGLDCLIKSFNSRIH